MKLVSIALLGLAGVFARYYFGIFAGRIFPNSFPFGTFLINMIGAFLIGVVWVLGMERHFLSQNLTIGLTVGLLGGFTTFSSYCLEFVRLLEESNLFSGFLYLSLSPFLGTLATYLGMLLARR